MKTVVSRDGTKIAYEKVGRGPVVILVQGALGTRTPWSKPGLADLLARHFTVISYDRRGRGDSTDTPPYSVDREIEDIEALIDAAGGSACLYGISSGGALVLEAASALGEKVKKLAVYEAPYADDPDVRKASIEYDGRLRRLLADGDRTAALNLFFRRIGVPDEEIENLRRQPVWQAFEALAPTLAYDSATLGKDRSIPRDRLRGITAPTLVLAGGASLAFMQRTAVALKEAIPNAEHRTLEGERHNVRAEALAPVLVEFFSETELRS